MVPDDPTRIHDGVPTGTHAILSGDPERMIGRTLKEAYRIEGKIGEGGMGVVFRATQVNLGRPVAIKMIHVASRIPATGVDRFFLEARLLSQLHHPNIVHIIDFGTEPGPLHFMVMEYLAGESLDVFVEHRGRLSPGLVLDLMEQICAGMTAAHNASAVHRDLKPSNIFVCNVTGSPRPIVKILDFGLGKVLDDHEKPGTGITREGVMMGTCGYSAPEQLHGGPVDERADIYSLGAILYFMVAGRPPYRDEGFRTTLVKQLTNRPDPIEPDNSWPDLPAVEAVIHKAMSVRPAERYATAAELLAVLRGAVRPEDTVTEGRSPSRIVQAKVLQEHPVPVQAGPKRRHWFVSAAAGLLLVLLAAGLWRVLGTRDGSPRKPDRAAVPGVSDDEIVFGISAPFTGPTKELGRGMQAGIEARFAAQNAAGGVHGRKLRLVVRDDGYEPKQTIKNVRKLLDEDRVFAFIGNVGTPTTKEVLPTILEENRLLFAPYTGARLLRREPPARYVFNYRASYTEETEAIVRHLLKRGDGLKPDQIAVFAQNDAYGDDGVEGVARALARFGRRKEDILRVGYDRNSHDVSDAVKKIVEAGDRVKAVVMVATYQPAAEFIQQIRDRGLKTLCTNISFVGSDTLAEKLRGLGGEKYARGVIVTQVVPPLDSASTGVLRFRKDMEKYSRTEAPGFVSLEGYIAASILIEALKKVGEDVTTEGLVDALESIRGLDLGIGSVVSFGPSRHQGSTKVWATVLDEKGVYHELELMTD